MPTLIVSPLAAVEVEGEASAEAEGESAVVVGALAQAFKRMLVPKVAEP